MACTAATSIAVAFASASFAAAFTIKTVRLASLVGFHCSNAFPHCLRWLLPSCLQLGCWLSWILHLLPLTWNDHRLSLSYDLFLTYCCLDELEGTVSIEKITGAIVEWIRDDCLVFKTRVITAVESFGKAQPLSQGKNLYRQRFSITFVAINIIASVNANIIASYLVVIGASTIMAAKDHKIL